MLIRIPHSWLLDFVETKATPKQIAEKLSLTSFSIERLEKVGSDHIYTIEPPPNRGDLLSVVGIAREVAAALPSFGMKAAFKSQKSPKISYGGKLNLKVKIENKSFCPRFSALILDNIKIKPSPKIIRDRLNKVEIRDLNNVVDVTNYFMVELGQPMHAFDYDKIKNAEMVLRGSRKGEKITTLDGVERSLTEEAIVIEDGSGRLIDLCGIMGGLNSEIDQNTKRVLLFVQIYDALKIRKATQALAHRTEAAARFEKGVDFEGVIPSLEQAAKMLQENAGAKVASKLIDIVQETPSQNWIKLEPEKINQIIGQKIEKAEVIRILKSLKFEIKDEKVRAPSWRNDTFEEIEDIAEEVARIHGYHNLPAILPEGKIPVRKPNREFYWESRIKHFLKHQGFFEIYTNSATNKIYLEKMGIDPKTTVKLLNPLSEDFEYLRPSLLPQLLLTLSENKNYAEEIRLFELAHTYLPTKKEKELPIQKMNLAGAYLSQKQSEDLFLKTKGVIEVLLGELGIMDYELKEAKSKIYQHAAEITAGNKVLGTMGLIKPGILSKFEVEQPVAAFDLDFETLTQLATIDRQFTPIPELPPVIEDLSVIVDHKVPADEILSTIKNLSFKSCQLTTKLADIYTDSKLGLNKKSITFQITYQALKKQLSGKEVKGIRGKITEALKKKHQATIRSI